MKVSRSLLMTGLLVFGLASTAAADVPETFEPIRQRPLASGELFGYDIGYGAKTLLEMIEEKLAQRPFTAGEITQLKEMLCDAGAPVRVLAENNAAIESLNDSHPFQVELKAEYKRLKVQTAIVPWINFCDRKMNIEDTVKAARKNQKIELEFFNVLQKLTEKYGS